jgi:hypothetical protein
MRRTSWQVGTLALSLVLGLAATAGAVTRQIVNGATIELQLSPQIPTAEDPIRLSAAITWLGCPIVYEAPVLSGGRIVILAAPSNPVPCPVGPNPVTSRYTATLPALANGTYEAVVNFQGVDAAATAFTVSGQGPDLFLFGGGRFDARLRRTDGGPISSVRLTGQSGYFWFFDSSNVEVTIKILDGRFVNGHFWVFVASMTDVPFTLTVIDLAGPGCQMRNCPQRVYSSPAGKNTNFIDVAAF